MKKDLTGKKFGFLTAVSVDSRSRNGHIRWCCLCDCGNTHRVLSTHLISDKITHCGCKSKSTKSKTWGGVGDISGDYFYSLKRIKSKTSSRSALEFSVTLDYLWDLFLSQDRKCALSGIELVFKHTNGVRTGNEQTASLDRIDSSIGYIVGNVQWVHKDINLMKNKLNQELFLIYCKKIVERLK